jgi:uncharacterized protein (DUF1778 family)
MLEAAMTAKRSERIEAMVTPDTRTELREAAKAQQRPMGWIVNSLLEQWAVTRRAEKQFAMEVRGNDDRRE